MRLVTLDLTLKITYYIPKLFKGLTFDPTVITQTN